MENEGDGLRRVTWRSWAVVLAIITLYIIAGVFYSDNASIEGLIYKWSLAGGTLAPIAVTIVYTLTGNRWWTNNVGTALVRVLLSIIPFAGPLAYVFWVQNGILGPGALAWIEVSSPALSVVSLLYLCWVFYRLPRR